MFWCMVNPNVLVHIFLFTFHSFTIYFGINVKNDSHQIVTVAFKNNSDSLFPQDTSDLITQFLCLLFELH